jgi:hypothetical protein
MPGQGMKTKSTGAQTKSTGAQTKSGTTSTTQMLPADDPRHGLTAHAPLFNLISGGGIIFIWGCANLYQALTTAQSIVMLLQMTIKPTTTMTAQDLLNLNNMTAQRYSGIASLIAWGIQAYLFFFAFPSDRAFLSAHKRYNADETSASISEKTKALADFKYVLKWTFIVGDIISDGAYAWFGGGDLLSILTPAGGARALVSALFAGVMLGLTLYAGQEGFHRFGLGLRAVRGQ